MLPRMQARRWLCVAAAALLLAAGGCHEKKKPAQDTGSTSGGIQPKDLKLDMSGAPGSKANPLPKAGTMGMTLDQLQKRWNDKAEKHDTQKISIWQRQAIPAFQAWRATTPLGRGVQLEVIGIGKGQVQTARVSAEPLNDHNRKTLFDAWETLRTAITPDISQEQLYKGLDLLSKPTARTRYMTAGGYIWQVNYTALRPAPRARITLTVLRAQPKPDADKPFSMLVTLGRTTTFGSMGSFSVEYSPASRGKTFEEAAQLCDKQGLSLCSDAQWHRACSQLGDMSEFSTWTASFNKDQTKLQARGGENCDSGDAVGAKDKDPKRGALCCTRNVAMTGMGSTAMKGMFTLPVLVLEQAQNHKNWKQLAQSLAPKLGHFYDLTDATRADAIKLAKGNAQEHPDRWSEHLSCDLKGGDRQMHFLLTCREDVFQGDQGMARVVQYGVNQSHIELVQQMKVLRKMGPM